MQQCPPHPRDGSTERQEQTDPDPPRQAPRHQGDRDGEGSGKTADEHYGGGGTDLSSPGGRDLGEHLRIDTPT